MPKVFISYRREDSAGFAGRIFDRLQLDFGRESVFIDVDSIPLGVDFRDHLADAVNQCDVILVIIGDRWAAGPNGQVRLNEPDDFVRIEIEAALARDIPVVPVLVGKTPMPREEELPPSLRPLAYRNACSLDPGSDFHANVDRLIRGMEQLGTRTGARESASATDHKCRYPGANEGAAVNSHPPVQSNYQLRIISGPSTGRIIRLNNDRVTFGRASTCDAMLQDVYVSRCHFVFEWDSNSKAYAVVPFGSRVVLAVNGVLVHESLRLGEGDQVRVGATTMVLERAAPPAAPDPAGL